MRNFGMMVKMMVAAVMMSAFFCSCNVAGGAAYDSYSEAKSTSYSAENSGRSANGQGGFKIVIPHFEISAHVEGDRSEARCGEALQMSCAAEEGSKEIGFCEWYVNGIRVATGTSFAFSQDRPGLYNVSCIAVDDADDPKYADSVQLTIKVR